jgi:hypothetical protein
MLTSRVGPFCEEIFGMAKSKITSPEAQKRPSKKAASGDGDTPSSAPVDNQSTGQLGHTVGAEEQTLTTPIVSAPLQEEPSRDSSASLSDSTQASALGAKSADDKAENPKDAVQGVANNAAIPEVVRAPPNDTRVALVLLIVAVCVRFYRLDCPNGVVFDEHQYVTFDRKPLIPASVG